MRKNNHSTRISLSRDLEKPRYRLFISAFFVLILLLGVFVKAAHIQFFNKDKALSFAKKQHNGFSELRPVRGNIYDRNNNELAINIEAKSIYANPPSIKDPVKTSKIISKNIGLNQNKVLKQITSKKRFVWIERLLESEQTNDVLSENLDGIGYIKEAKRVYPNGHLLGQVLGFTNTDSSGIEGIEYSSEYLLAGTPRKISFTRDALGRAVVKEYKNPDTTISTAGNNITLTISYQIQHILERELQLGIESVNGVKGMGILMNSETGEILAMASYPFFDPNNFSEYKDEQKRNFPIWYAFEPGSTMKVFLAASAIEENTATPKSKFDCENGKRKIGNWVIRDLKPHGTLTFSEIIKVSSNIGASKIGETLGKKKYHDYLTDFGFGNKLGIDLPGESKGQLPKVNKWGNIELATISFGQGLSVTSLQLATALSAVANGGYLMKPFIVKEVRSPEGKLIKENKPQVLKRVISYDTSRQVSEILESAVANGTGRNAHIKGYSIAGKTGTAQIPNPATGGYYKNRYIASFIGFAPVDNPAITLVIVVEAPKKSFYGGTVAAPIFKNVTEKVLFYLGIPPSNNFMEARIMPDLKGRSMRDILRWSEKEGIKVEISGNGYVEEQMPNPGEIIEDDVVCKIHFKPTI